MTSLSDFLNHKPHNEKKESTQQQQQQQEQLQGEVEEEEGRSRSSSIRSSFLNKSLADIYSIVRRASTESSANPQEDDPNNSSSNRSSNNNWYCNFEPNHDVFTDEENAILSQLAKELNMLHDYDVISIWETESTISTLDAKRRLSQTIKRISSQQQQSRDDSAATTTSVRRSISIAEAAASAVASAAASDPEFAASLDASSSSNSTTSSSMLSGLMIGNKSNTKIKPKQPQNLKLQSLPPSASNRSYLPGMYQHQQQQETYLKDDDDSTDDDSSTTSSSRPSIIMDRSSIVERASFLLDYNRRSGRRGSDTTDAADDQSLILRTSVFTPDQNAILTRLSQELKMLQEENNNSTSNRIKNDKLDESASVFTMMTENNKQPRISSASQSTMNYHQQNMSLFSLEQELKQADDAHAAYATRHSLCIAEVAAAAAAADPNFAKRLSANLSEDSQDIIMNLIRDTTSNKRRISATSETPAAVSEEEEKIVNINNNKLAQEEAEEAEVAKPSDEGGGENTTEKEVEENNNTTTSPSPSPTNNNNNNNNQRRERCCGVCKYVNQHIPFLSPHLNGFSNWVDSIQSRIQYMCWKIGKIVTLSP